MNYILVARSALACSGGMFGVAIGSALMGRNWSIAAVDFALIAALVTAHVMFERWSRLTDLYLEKASTDAEIARQLLIKVRQGGPVEVEHRVRH